MISKVKAFLIGRKGKAQAGTGGHGTGSHGTGGHSTGGHSQDELHLAAAALMCDAALADGEMDENETQIIRRMAENSFGLNQEEATELIGEARARAERATDNFAFTRVLVKHFDHDERVVLVEMLWEVVYGDGILHDYEASLLRRVAGLLHVPDRESGAARKRVRERLGVET